MRINNQTHFNFCVDIFCAYAQACGAAHRPLNFGYLLILSMSIRLRVLLVKIFSHCTAFQNGTRKESGALQQGEAQLLEARKLEARSKMSSLKSLHKTIKSIFLHLASISKPQEWQSRAKTAKQFLTSNFSLLTSSSRAPTVRGFRRLRTATRGSPLDLTTLLKKA